MNETLKQLSIGWRQGVALSKGKNHLQCTAQARVIRRCELTIVLYCTAQFTSDRQVRSDDRVRRCRVADRHAAEGDSTRLSASPSFCLHHQSEVPVKYLPRIAASGALLVVALGIVTFAQIKFAPQSAENNPVARIVLNVESQLND
ncbi:hypothetical protein [Paraburkholderia sp. ZP32-5]|uniref:hypothetical protein n=1 Tax=Paraburkholderia sp. ZP32-5 TaxID=2883245 RepID=UPI001F1CBF73|nr:hypothetical protein [Paraburkholderia sp. ZP32-5]